MSEQFQEHVSAFMDDELPAEECAFLVRRLERDPEFRDRALRYSVIGAAMRGELLNPDPDLLRRRVREELDGIPSTGRERMSPAASSRLIRPAAAGFGIAAAVALAALPVLSTLNRPADSGGPSRLGGLETAAAPSRESPSATSCPMNPSATSCAMNPSARSSRAARCQPRPSA